MPHPRDKAAKLAALKTRFGVMYGQAAGHVSERRVQKNLRLPESAAARLATLAEAEGLSQAALVVKALEAYAARRKLLSE